MNFAAIPAASMERPIRMADADQTPTQSEPPVSPADPTRFASAADTSVQATPHLPEATPDPGATRTHAKINPTAPLPAAADEAPKLFGRYRIESEIGRGGMGVVYRALDTQVQRSVALKVMLADHPEPEAVERFLREGRIAARLHHPNIVPVYDLGRVDGKLYMTMEWIEGEPLSHVLQTMGRMPPRAALRIGRDVARALAHAHEENCIHRDIKPSNVLVTTVGAATADRQEDRDSVLLLGRTRSPWFRVLVADFGLAKDLGGEARLTKTGNIMGTPAYMSPEQIEGVLERIGPGTDQYSLGVLLYELLAGDVPFTAEDPVQVLHLVATTDPPPLRVRAPGLHPDVETIVAKAMERDPARRYAGCRELADDLDRYLRGEPILARPAGRLARGWRKLRRNRPLFRTLVGAAFLLFAQVAYFGVWPGVKAGVEARRAAAERQGREVAARAGLAEAEAELTAGRIDEAIAKGGRLLDANADAGRRGEDVRIPSIHDLLARARARKGDAQGALLERYRSYRAAQGSGEHGEFLLKAARELAEQGRHEEALLLLRGSAAGARPAECAYWRGRAREGIMDFRAAARLFEQALADRGLPAELRAEAAAHREFCRAFAREHADPLGDARLWVGDLDGDGVREIVVRERDDLVLGRFGKGGWEPRARVALALPGKWRAWPLAGFGAPALLVANADVDPCVVQMVFLREGRLEPAGALTFNGHVSAAVAYDIDGDGRREIVLSDYSPKKLYFLDCDRTTGRLHARGEVGFASHVNDLRVLDFDGDGKEDLLAAFGPWGGYGVQVLAIDPQRGLVPIRHASLGIPSSLAQIDRGSRAPALAVSVRWRPPPRVQMETIWGAEEFRRRFRPVGVYLVEAGPEREIAVTPLCRNETAEPFDGDCRVLSARTPAGQFLFCSIGVEGGAADWRVLRADDLAHPFARLVVSQLPGAPGADLAGADDLDGDGFDELVLAGDATAPPRVLDAESGSIAAGPDVDAATPTQGETRSRSPALEYADACARVGLDEEAAGAYLEAADRSAALAESREALEGRIRCLARLRKPDAIVAEAATAADRFPDAAAAVAREALRVLDAGRWWPQAAEIACRLGARIDLTAAERAGFAEEARRFRAFADPPQRLTLIGAEAAKLDWLATSPLPVAVDRDGRWTLYVSGHSQDRIGVPLGGRWGSWRQRVRMGASRHEWGTSWRVGLFQLDLVRERELSPIAFYLGSGGGTAAPVYHLAAQRDRFDRALFQGRALWGAEPLALEMFGVGTRNELIAQASGVVGRADTLSMEIPAPPPGDPVWAGVEFRGGQNEDSGAVVRLEELALAWIEEGVKPIPARPVSALDHFLLANGRWIVGRTAEALALYDTAIRCADLDAARDEAARAAHLPAAADAWSPNGVAGFVAVDARFYRGLLHAALGDAASARADLEDACRRSPARVHDLLVLYHRALLDAHEPERQALRAFWKPRIAGGNPAEHRGRLERLVQEQGSLVAGVLCDEVLTVKPVQAAGIMPDGAWGASRVANGDLVEALDGEPIADLADLRQRIEAAAKAGRATVRLAVQRGNRSYEFEVPSRLVGVELTEMGGAVRFRE